MKTLVLPQVLFIMWFAGCDVVVPHEDASVRLEAVSPALHKDDPAWKGRKPERHPIRYVVTDGLYHRRFGFAGATIGYTSARGDVQLNDIVLPWTTTVPLPSGTAVRLSVLFSPSRRPLTVSIFQGRRLLASRTAVNGEAHVDVIALIE